MTSSRYVERRESVAGEHQPPEGLAVFTRPPHARVGILYTPPGVACSIKSKFKGLQIWHKDCLNLSLSSVEELPEWPHGSCVVD